MEYSTVPRSPNTRQCAPPCLPHSCFPPCSPPAPRKATSRRASTSRKAARSRFTQACSASQYHRSCNRRPAPRPRPQAPRTPRSRWTRVGLRTQRSVYFDLNSADIRGRLRPGPACPRPLSGRTSECPRPDRRQRRRTGQRRLQPSPGPEARRKRALHNARQRRR